MLLYVRGSDDTCVYVCCVCVFRGKNTLCVKRQKLLIYTFVIPINIVHFRVLYRTLHWINMYSPVSVYPCAPICMLCRYVYGKKGDKYK